MISASCCNPDVAALMRIFSSVGSGAGFGMLFLMLFGPGEDVYFAF